MAFIELTSTAFPPWSEGPVPCYIDPDRIVAIDCRDSGMGVTFGRRPGRAIIIYEAGHQARTLEVMEGPTQVRNLIEGVL